MPYTKFDKTQPNFRNERDEFVDNSRNQLIALRDAFADGRLAGPFSIFINGGQQPFSIVYLDLESLRASITWGTTGGALDQPTQIVHERKADQLLFTPTDTIGTETLTYDADGNLDTITWS